MSELINHSLLQMTNENGESTGILYPQNDGTDVSIDTSKNSSIPANVSNVQDLTNNLGGAAFLPSSDITNLQDDVTTLQNQAKGIILSVPEANWSTSGSGYVNTLTINGITGNETLTASLYDTGSLTEAEITTFDEIITKMETKTNQIVLTASEKPTVSFSIVLTGEFSINNQGFSNLGDVQKSIDTVNNRVTVVNSRINSLATLTEGSTTGDAELMDIRNGANGVTYDSAGDAVRGQVTEIKEDLVELKDSLYSNEAMLLNEIFIASNIINGTYDKDNGVFYPDSSRRATILLYIPYECNSFYTNIKLNRTGALWAFFFDSNKNYITYKEITYSEDNIIVENIENARYVSFNIITDGSYVSWANLQFIIKYNEYLDPRHYGAVYDGIIDCTNAINRCLSSGAKVRLIGDGTALVSNTLLINKNNTELLLDNGFTIKLSNNSNVSLIATSGGLYDYNSPKINTERLKNITIQGGILDFNGANQKRGTSGGITEGFGMRIADVDNFIMRDCTLKDPCAFGFQGGGLHKFVIENINLDYDNLRPNMDGIHLNGDCLDGKINHITGNTNDDMVALNGHDGQRYMLRDGDIRRVCVSDISCVGNGYRAIRVLNNATNVVDEITIDGIYGEYKYDAITLSSYESVESIIKRVIVRNVFGKFGTKVINFSTGSEKLTVKDLIIDGIISSTPNLIYAGSNVIVENLTLNNVSIKTDEDISANILIEFLGTLNNLIVNNLDCDNTSKLSKIIKCGAVNSIFNNVKTNSLYAFDILSDGGSLFLRNCNLKLTNGGFYRNNTLDRVKGTDVTLNNFPTSPSLGDIVLKSDGVYVYKSTGFELL